MFRVSCLPDFLITAAFNLSPDLKYPLLETRSTVERLTKMREIMRQTVGKMEETAEVLKIAKTNGHAKNGKWKTKNEGIFIILFFINKR